MQILPIFGVYIEKNQFATFFCRKICVNGIIVVFLQRKTN